jgi:HlyD family secretion protein
MNRKYYGALAVVILIAVAVGALYSRGSGETGGNGNSLEYAAVVAMDMEILAEAAGQLEPIRVVEVKSKASGDVLRLHAETGDRIARGTLLAEIDPRDVRSAFLQADADLEVAQARHATSAAQLQRVRELRAANVVTEQELESAQLDYANANAQLIRARSSLELARERLNDVTIRAPIDGTVIRRDVEVGQIIASASQNISGGTNLFLMADLAEMQVRALVDETDLGRVQPGMPVRVSVEAYPDRVFQGSVLKIEPQAVVEQNVTMFPVLVHLDNSEGYLRPGMNADVRIEVARRMGAITVPNAAIVGVRDAVAAGAVVGFSEQAMQTAMRGPGGQGQGGQGGGAAAVPNGPANGAAARSPQGAGAQPGAARQGQPGAGGQRQQGGAGVGAQRGGGTDSRPGIVFVATESGIEPRRVMLGVNDWDNTEVLSGLQAGEYVVLISVARLQAQQEEFARRMRERAGGIMPGAPGGGPGRR